MSEKTKSVVKSVSVLSIAGIICKFIGVLFSIPLNMISTDVAADFYLVYPTYTLLLTISSAGLPVAVSRLVAGYLARNDRRNAWNTFRCALMTLFTVGLFFSILMILCNRMLVNMVGVEETSAGYYAIAPCVVIVCVLSAFRGLFQGQQNMVPTAVSQVMEQVGKVALSLPLAALGLKQSVTAGAAGALLGITLSETIALAYIVIRFYVKKKEFDSYPQDPDLAESPRKALLSRLVMISIPITISACIIPFSQFVDSAMMVNRMVFSGIERDVAKAYYGIFTSVVIRLINIPTALALAISMSLVPAISAYKAKDDHAGICRETHTGMRYAFIIGFPCSVGMSILAKQIVYFFYGNVSGFSEAKMILASELLTFSAMTVVLFTVVQATSSILQGLRKQKIPMYTMIAGVAVKILLNYILIGTPGIHIHGGPYASIACYSVVMIINTYYLCKYTNMRFNIIEWVLRPGAAAAVMGVTVWLLQRLLPMNRFCTIVEIAAGIAVYAAAAVLLKVVSVSDIRKMIRRKGRKV
ncbi:MAG: polysaccharide biosynthesis protein [Clostridia bacterium]|nr:polysaccharide biosynthesis protein [Clostridia bacterium]MBR2664219.1 polysaccharide biosynthesis protein [Clostridia bacterium]